MKLSEDQKRAWASLLVGQAMLVKQMNRVMAEHREISMEVYDVLLNLELAPDMRLKLTDLAERAVLSPSGVTRLVDRLEAQGLVVRDRCPSDRRAIYARLTEAGLATRERAWATYEPAIQEHFAAHLTPDETTQIGAILGKFVHFGDSGCAKNLKSCGG